MAAITLLEYAKTAFMNGEDHQAGIIKTFAESTDLLGVMPFTNIKGNALTYTRQAALPSTAFRKVNGTYTANVGTHEKQTESLMIAGGLLEVDRSLVKMNGPEARTGQEIMKATSLAQTISHKMIKGSSATTAEEFDGLQGRCTGTQLLANGATAAGDPLSLAKLDELIDKVDRPTHLLMSQAMRRLLTGASRISTVGGQLERGVDQFGRKIDLYNGLPILLADKNDDLNASLAFDEVGLSAGTTCTSIYCLSVGEGRLCGIQSGPMEVLDLGLISPTVYTTLVEWLVGFMMAHPRAAARLYSITNAAVTV